MNGDPPGSNKRKMKANVLVTTAGTIVAQGVIKCLRLANRSKDRPVTYRIVTADMSPDTAALYRSDTGYLVPPISSPDYIDAISKICKDEVISAIFVGADEELLSMASARERIENETGAVVITNPVGVINICTDKWKTFQFLKNNNLPCPESSLPEDEEKFLLEHGFPVIVKPRQGHGSLHVCVAKSHEDVRQAVSTIQHAGWQPMIQEYVLGEDLEFTTGVTVDRKGKYVMSSIAMRRTLKAGQTYKAFIDDYKEVRRTSEEAALKLGSRGPINVQGRLSGDQLKIFEINPRFSASCPLRAFAKVNEPDIVFRNSVLQEEIKVDGYERLVCMRYWNEVYIPYSTYERAVSERKVELADSVVSDYF